MIGKLIGLTGLAFGLLGFGGVAIAAEPPAITPEDISGIDISSFISQRSLIPEMSLEYSVGFTSTVTRMGDLFVHRIFKTNFYFAGNSSVLIDLTQIDCASKRYRVLHNRYVSRGESVDNATPSEWRNFVTGSVEENSCQKAYADRAISATAN